MVEDSNDGWLGDVCVCGDFMNGINQFQLGYSVSLLLAFVSGREFCILSYVSLSPLSLTVVEVTPSSPCVENNSAHRSLLRIPSKPRLPLFTFLMASFSST